MIQTEVKALGANEYQVEVAIARQEYDAVYAEQLAKLAKQVRLPGFRPGKAPLAVVRQQFGAKAYDEAVNALLQRHYVAIIEQSGLKPAVQPEIDALRLEADKGLCFSLKVATWPEVEALDLDGLSFTRTEVVVEDADIDAVIERLMKSQVKYVEHADREAERGDQLRIDFVGFIDGEPFEGGRGEDVVLVLGEGRFISGFEDQLIGRKAGEECVVEVTFPETYQAEHLAGKSARFNVVVKAVAEAVHAEDEAALADMLGFDDAQALRADVAEQLAEEAAQASREATTKAAQDALLAANEVTMPEAIIVEDMRESMRRVVQNMQRQGVQVTREMIEDPAFKDEVRRRSERGLKLSVLLQAVRRQGGIEVSDEEVRAEIERKAADYPAAEREQFKQWLESQAEQREAIRERLLEDKCIDYIVSHANTNVARQSLSAWQQAQEGAA